VGIRVSRGNIYEVKSKHLIGSFGYGGNKVEAADQQAGKYYIIGTGLREKSKPLP